MPRIDENSKLQRKERVLIAVREHPNGISENELADLLQFGRRTANNYLRELEDEGRIYKDGRLWFPLLFRKTRLSPFELSPEEAVTLYLGARLLVKQQDKRNEPAETALLKLAHVLKSDAGVGEEIEQAAQELARRPPKAGFPPVFRTIVQGYIYRKRIALRYKPLNGRPFDTIFSTYLLEPSLTGFSTYLIGHSSIVDKLRAYKLERVESARLTREGYTIPADFPGLEILRSAWSIITGEELVSVLLRFSPQVRERVLETTWHPSQTIEDDPQRPGYLLWRARVANTMDMMPWLRGWGADCEVLEPEELRDSLAQEAIRLGLLYLGGNHTPSPERLLWAKTDRSGSRVHRLVYHLIDVGQVTLALWRLALPKQTRRQFAGWLSIDEEAAGRLLAFWASLHDLGKAAPGFQRKYMPEISPLQAAGFTFPEPSVQPARHGAVTAWALKTLLSEQSGHCREDASQVARAVGGHHGAWPTPAETGPAALRASDLGDSTWDAARKRLVQMLQAAFQPPQGISLPAGVEAKNALLVQISGLISVADWIGSMESFFPYLETILPIEQYTRRAAQQAEIALRALGWVDWTPEGKALAFDKLFPFTPNPIQQSVIASTEAIASPALVILESPTGCGKTEAALYLADTWLQAWQGRGLYIAMPTQATSNQMHQRFTDFLARRYPRQTLNLHLVHGAALLAEVETPPSAIAGEEMRRNEGSVRAAGWFLPRKRTLLAPFGVGTVDQALMSVLQTRHFFVRLFGLGQKVVIFDEVHAYDTYMSTLFQQLLRWLRAIGTSAILLSATLPEKTRCELAAAWLGQPQVELPKSSYPRLTVVAEGQAMKPHLRTCPLPAPASRTLRLERISPDPQAIAGQLAQSLRDGGCAAVICNRVKRAQEVYQALKDANIVPLEELILFHARFPFAWREQIEDKVLERFEKGGSRPGRAIVVATQVIEQSLDLDFDYMITDFAPLDLLLQRAGRLHRHAQNDAARPPGLREPRLALACPTGPGVLPDFGQDERIYERAVLLRSWLALRGRDEIILPQETSDLIEAAYAPEPALEGVEPELAQAVTRADRNARIDQEQEVYQAMLRLIRVPDDRRLLLDANQSLEEEDARVHDAFRALTRLAEPSVALVCLHRTEHGLALEPDGTGAPLEIDQPPSPDLIRKLLRRVVNIQHRDVVDYFTRRSKPLAWKEIAALRYHDLAIFDERGRCPLEGTPLTLVLSRDTGLEVIKEAL